MGRDGHFGGLVIEHHHFDLALVHLLEVVMLLVVFHEDHFHLPLDVAVGQVHLVRRESNAGDRLQLEQFLLQLQGLGIVDFYKTVEGACDEEVHGDGNGSDHLLVVLIRLGELVVV